MTPRKPQRPPEVHEPPSWVQRGEGSPLEQLDPDARARLLREHAEKLQAERRAKA